MDSSQYPDRKQFKRDQRTPAYRELQRRTAADRQRLERQLKHRGEVIKKLAGKLGMNAAELKELLQEPAATDQATQTQAA